MKLRIYNGTNHENAIYNPRDCYTDRKGKYFLQKNGTEPLITLEREQPLCAQVISKSLNNSEEYPLFFADAMSYISLTPMNRNPEEYDVILVSSIYAMLASQAFGMVNQSMLDRLYIPVPLYDTHDQTKKIGCAGLKKVCKPFSPQEYVVQIQSGFMPSLASINVCIEWFAQCGRPIDQMTFDALEELKRYVSSLTTVPQFYI